MTQVSITISDAHLSTISQVADALRTRGMRVEQVLGDLGIITGSVAPDRRPLLETVDGVAAVVDEQHHRLPPPDSPLQ